MRQSIIDSLISANWRQVRFSIHMCPLCNGKRIFVKLVDNEIGVCCLSCKATSITLSLVYVLRTISPNLSSKIVYELSSRGALMKFLKQHCKSVICSEFFDDLPAGEFKSTIQCQDVQKLTHPDEIFDICTSTEVFEHVPNDSKGFSEIRRVLKPTGVFVFTIPIDIRNITIERALPLPGGGVQHLLPAEYHGDPIRVDNRILAFRNYGKDILERLISAGFKKAEIRNPGYTMPWGFRRPVIVAYREDASNNLPNSDASRLCCASR